MREEALEPSFARYLTVKRAVVAYGLSEKFEHEQNLESDLTSSASRRANVVLINPLREYVQVPMGAGKTHLLAHLAASGNVNKTFDILSEALANLEEVIQFTIGQGGSMATQQPSTAEEQSVEQIIWHIRTTLVLPYRVRLASRLSELQRAVQEEEFDGAGISVGSVQHFVKFIEAYPTLRCPAISVTPARNIYASWKSGSERVFSIHFLPEGEVRFVLFHPNYKHPGQTIRLSGTATVDVVMSIAATQGVLDWASE
jgi:hypothetical protein